MERALIVVCVGLLALCVLALGWVTYEVLVPSSKYRTTDRWVKEHCQYTGRYKTDTTPITTYVDGIPIITFIDSTEREYRCDNGQIVWW